MPRTPAQDKAIKKYEHEKIDKVLLRLPKGTRDMVHEHAASRGESLNAFILRAIRETIQREKEE